MTYIDGLNANEYERTLAEINQDETSGIKRHKRKI